MKWYKLNTAMLDKIREALSNNYRFHQHRDLMNAALHLEQPRFSPLLHQTGEAIDLCNELDELELDKE